MRPRESYTPFMAAGLVLTLTIAAAFQAYLLREPGRIAADGAADQARAVAAGGALYAESCAACHGPDGEGGLGPALNARELLATTGDETLFSLIRSGVPGSVMPAWGQVFGGPLTDEQVGTLVAFVRTWEPDAPDRRPEPARPDAVRGATIFAGACYACHGENGMGTGVAPALNDPATLRDFDDAWYRSTIAHGRPARGMPTWGTVLSPQQIEDVVALIAAWREGRAVMPDISLKLHLRGALFAVQQFDQDDARFHLDAALAQAGPAEAAAIQAVIEQVAQKDWDGAQAGLLAFLPPAEIGRELFGIRCAACHGPEGLGGLGKNLHANSFVRSQSDDELIAFLLAGRPGTAMAGFQSLLTSEDLGYIVALLRGWQE
jgi:mono/diheme cytochrome c family protein